MTSSCNSIIKSNAGQSVERFSFPLQIPSASLASSAKREKQTVQKEEEKPPDILDPPAENLKEVSRESDTIREQAETKAAGLLKDASEQAEKILAQAREKAEALKAEAISNGREEGYQKGFESGFADGQAKVGQALKEQQEMFREKLEQALSSVETAKKASLEKYLEELKDCCLAVAEKVICISLKSSGQVIKHMLVAETEKLKKTDWVKIYMEKSDYSMMMEADSDVVKELSRLSDNIKFVVMDKGDSGSCIIEMPEEIVDMSVDTQLDNIRDLLETIQV